MTNKSSPKPTSPSRKNAQTDQWAEIQERGSYWGMRVLMVVYRCGGNLLLYPLVGLVVFYFFLTRAATRRYSRLYLKRVLSAPVRVWDIWLHHWAFARALLDRIAAWMGKIKLSDVSLDNRALLIDLKAQKKGAILLGAHLGNLEMCRGVVENDGYLTLNVILHSHNTAKINRLMQSLHPNVQVRLIQIDEINPVTAMRLRAMLDNGEFIILLADRLPPGEQPRFIEYPFLGAPARFPVGPFWLALLLGAPVFFMTGMRTPTGYRAALEPLSDGAPVARKKRDAACQQLMASYIEKLEATCRAHPYQWFNFYDYWRDDHTKTTTESVSKRS